MRGKVPERPFVWAFTTFKMAYYTLDEGRMGAWMVIGDLLRKKN